MNYRKTAAFVTAALVLCGLCSCGKSSTDSSSEKAPVTTVSGEVNTDSSNAESETNENSGDSYVATVTQTDANGEIVTTTASSGGGSKVTTTAASGGGTSSATTTAKPSGGSEATTESSSEEKDYTGEITLGSTISSKGSNIKASGSTVTITGGGTYHISGSSSQGQIIVSTATEEKIKLVLDGITLSNSNGPAIFIDEAKRCTIELAKGTVTTLKDGGKDKINDGVIFSNDTLRIKGSGTLNITSGNAHGIASDDDVIIENGNINITSIKSGIFAHDDITIEGGKLNIKGGTNGLKSKGTIHINGGESVVSGGTKEEKCSVYAASGFVYKDGKLFAAGNSVSSPTSSPNPCAIVSMSGGTPAANTNVIVSIDGKQMASFAPHNSFRNILVLAPEIKKGSKLEVKVGGSGDSYTFDGGLNKFSLSVD